jgi:hypothetical protein
VIDAGAIRSQHIGNGAPILVLAACLGQWLLSHKPALRRRAWLIDRNPALLWAVDVVEADTVSLVIVQDFDN